MHPGAYTCTGARSRQGPAAGQARAGGSGRAGFAANAHDMRAMHAGGGNQTAAPPAALKHHALRRCRAYHQASAKGMKAHGEPHGHVCGRCVVVLNRVAVDIAKLCGPPRWGK